MMGWVGEVHRWFWDKSLELEMKEFLSNTPETSSLGCKTHAVSGRFHIENKVSKLLIKLMPCLRSDTVKARANLCCCPYSLLMVLKGREMQDCSWHSQMLQTSIQEIGLGKGDILGRLSSRRDLET